MWGRRICGPGPLYIRAQDPSRGDLLSRTHNESLKKAHGCGRERSHAQHPIGQLNKKDELSAGAGQGKKLSIQQ